MRTSKSLTLDMSTVVSLGYKDDQYRAGTDSAGLSISIVYIWAAVAVLLGLLDDGDSGWMVYTVEPYRAYLMTIMDL